MRRLDPLDVSLRSAALIEASAGTGKTYTIATLYVRLVVERGLDPARILVVTFTEAAAAELRERIRSRLRAAIEAYLHPDAVTDPALAKIAARRRELGLADSDRTRLELAVRSFDEASISTIHGFCHRVLIDSAFETGVPFETELIINETPLLDLVVRDFWARELYEADPLFVGHLLKRRVTLWRWLRLAGVAASHPDAPIIPRHAEFDADPDVAPFRASFEAARGQWLAHADEVSALLLDHAGLYKNQYPHAELPGWFQAADAFFRQPTPGTQLDFAQLDKFTRESLTRFTKKDFARRGQVPTHPFFDACSALAQARAPLSHNFDQRYVDLKRRLADFVRRELPRRKQASGVQSFDDLLHRVDRALRARGGRQLAETIRGRYQAALIDEFQDTDPVQFRIFRSIYAKSELPLFLIGDPKQAIYGFRGADVFAYLEAARSTKRNRYTMETNWRSDPGLLAAIEHLFDVPRPFMIEDIEFVRVGARPGAGPGLKIGGAAAPPFELRFVPTAGAETRGKQPQITREWADANLPDLVARDIATLLASDATIPGSDGPVAVHAGHVAVLVRKNAQAQAVQAALRKLGIPGVVFGDASVFDTREADELSRVLCAVAEPTHSSFLRAAITTELLGVTASQLHAMTEDDRAWSGWIDDFRCWHRLWTDRGFVQMFRAMLVDSGASRRLLALADGERRMTNLLHLAELLHRAASEEHLGPAGLLQWFQQERRADQTMVEAVKLRLERDDRAVQLITVHRAKGLEYPVVYCPYLWDPDELRADEEENLLFHDPESNHRLTLDISAKSPDRRKRAEHPHIAQARFEAAAESLRLLYVALTRARHRCVVVWGQFDRAHHSGLGYLLHSSAAGTEGGWDPAGVAAKIRSCDDDAMLAWLEQRKHESWHVSIVDGSPAPAYQPELGAGSALQCRTPRDAIDRLYRTSSFSHMTAGVGHTRMVFEEGRDHDELAQSGRGDMVDAPPSQKISLADFPRGAQAGNFFHEVLERLDFQTDPPQLRDHVATALRAYGFAEHWLDAVCEGLGNTLATPLRPIVGAQEDTETVCLKQIERRDRVDELGFVFPADRSQSKTGVTATHLAQVFEAHPQGLPPGYPGRLAGLGFAPLRGFVKGFVDLIFRHNGRWYLADYKTNHLGDTTSCYGPERLTAVMAHDHYVLQYHLYSVALVRFLRRRVRGFDYERDFGGVYYLFLRGMSPANHGTTGVFYERPPRARIEALSKVLSVPGRGAS